MLDVCSHPREYRKVFLRDHFPHSSQILEGIHFWHFGTNTCRACIRTRANTGKKSWRIIYVLVSCQRYVLVDVAGILHYPLVQGWGKGGRVSGTSGNKDPENEGSRSQQTPVIGFGKRGLLEKGSFQKRPLSREFRDSREPPDCGKQRRIRPFSREPRDFRDSRDSSSEKTPFVTTPFLVPEVTDLYDCTQVLQNKCLEGFASWKHEIIEPWWLVEPQLLGFLSGRLLGSFSGAHDDLWTSGPLSLEMQAPSTGWMLYNSASPPRPL